MRWALGKDTDGFVEGMLSYNLDGLTLEQDVLYHFRVLTKNSVGTTIGAWVKYDSRAQKPFRVKQPVVKQGAGSTGLFVSWKRPGKSNGIILQYIVHMITSGNTTTTTTDQNFMNVDDVAPATVYSFAVEACNKQGCTKSDGYVSFRTADVLAKGLARPTLSAITSKALTVSWTAPKKPNGNMLGYVISLDCNSRPLFSNWRKIWIRDVCWSQHRC